MKPEYKLIEAKQAVRHTLRELKKREIVRGFKLKEGEKGIIGAIIETQHWKYFMKFQKQVYRNFSYRDGTKVFDEEATAFPREDLYDCYDNNIIPMVVFKDGSIYICTASRWIDWSIKYHSKDYPTIIRKEDRKVKTDNLTYYNIPIRELTPF